MPEDAAQPEARKESEVARRRGNRIMIGLLLLIALWFGADVFYALRILRHRLAWERGVARNAEGLRTACAAFTMGEGEPALLMIHGFADSPAFFRPLAEALAPRGYTCRAMRLPGAGEMPAAAARVTHADWQAAIEGELAALREAGHRPIWIVAHSMGGALAVNLLAEQPDAADGLALLSPLARISEKRSPGLSPRAWYEIGRRVMWFSRVIESPFPMDVRHPAEPMETYPRERYVPTAAYHELFAVLGRVPAAAGRLSGPLLVLVGAEDAVVDRTFVRVFFETSACAPKAFHEYPDTGHVLSMESIRGDVIERLDAFFRATSAGRGEGAPAAPPAMAEEGGL